MSELERDRQTFPKQIGGGGAFLGRFILLCFVSYRASSWLVAAELSL